MRAFAFLLLVLMPLPVLAATGPSFDCARARSATEKLVCSDAGLAAQDFRLASVLAGLKLSHPEWWPALLAGQRQWLAGRDAQCAKDADRVRALACLKRAYGERVAALSAKGFVICGQRKSDWPSFDTACQTLNDPLQLTVDMIGRADGDAYQAGTRAKITALKIAAAGGMSQTLPVSDADIFYSSTLQGALELMDVNFDGYSDIKLMTSTSAGPNEGFTYWLYDRKARGFKPCGACDALSGFDVIPDPRKKTIFVNARGSCCNWGSTTYAWRGAALKTIESGDTGILSLQYPPFAGASLTACGAETDHYDAQERIASAAFALDKCDAPAGKPDDLLAYAKAHQKGFKLDVKDKDNFTIRYDPPLKTQ